MADEVRRYELTSKTDLKNGLYSESLFSSLSLPNVGPNTRVYVRILTVSCFSVNLTICSLIIIATRLLWRIFSTFLFSVKHTQEFSAFASLIFFDIVAYALQMPLHHVLLFKCNLMYWCKGCNDGYIYKYI